MRTVQQNHGREEDSGAEELLQMRIQEGLSEEVLFQNWVYWRIHMLFPAEHISFQNF